MREGNVFNGIKYHKGYNLLNILKKTRGFSRKFKTFIEPRFETFAKIPLDTNKNSYFFLMTHLLSFLLPKKANVTRKHLSNIYILDLLSLYRGWRHSRNLPVRGQRTWSNSWTAFKCNNLLKQIRIKKGRRMYGNLPLSEIYTAQLAEQINLVWKEQWFSEWSSARTFRLKSSAHKNVIKTDLFSMAQGNVMSPIKFQKLSKKQQQAHNKNHFSLGFELGFTKPLLKELYELRATGKKFGKYSSVILHKSDMTSRKKNVAKKKVDLKAKKAAHIAKKKSKKSVWD